MIFVTYTEDKQKSIHEFTGVDPGYGGTAKMVLASAIMLLTENKRLPVKGGVLTPGAAFGRTTLINHLEKEGILFSRK